MALDETLDPVEQLIQDLFLASPPLRGVFGPFFDWVTESQALPYCNVFPVSGPTEYTMDRTAIEEDLRQFSVFSTDRAWLVSVAGTLNGLFERIANAPMQTSGHYCLSILPTRKWRFVFEQESLNGNQNTNCWHGSCDYSFRIQRNSGVL